MRQFEAKPAVRESVPLLVGLFGPSGAGKTYSALRLATGIQSVAGGEIYGIDTESRRMLHYADDFKFRHLQFGPPFGSLDYLAAIQHCVKHGAKVVIIDSMSHEHQGPGGYLLTQEAEVDRMAGDDLAKRERVKFAGWIKPAAYRQQMIAGILQLNVNLIFCFRAKEKIKIIKGVREPQQLGFMPIAGEELLFEMTINCLLLPKSGGVPSWRSDQIGERLMLKLPKQFEETFAKSQPLSEDIGRQLAEWARGGVGSPVAAASPAEPASPHPSTPAPQDAGSDDFESPSQAEPEPAYDSEMLIRDEAALTQAAEHGMDALRNVWMTIPKIRREDDRLIAVKERFKTKIQSEVKP